jgi:hypothetical protein
VTDLSAVWVVADLHEGEASLVHAGAEATIELPSSPGETITGRIAFVPPTLSDATRTVRVRIEVPNADGRLKPGQYATVSIAVDAADRLTVDVDAVIDTGVRQVAFVETSEGIFEPREVALGPRSGGRAVVLSGLSAGEKVVSRATSSSIRRAGSGPACRRRRTPVTRPTETLHDHADHRALRAEPPRRPPRRGGGGRDGRLVAAARRARRDPGPLGHAGHRLLALGPQPDVIEDQVTYPIVSALLGAPRVKAVRGFSDFGFSYVYIVFQDGTDMYWARSRTLEYLSKILPRLPEGVRTELGPDATGVGWVYQYALVDTSGAHDLAELRTFQDWRLRTWLQSVPGVAEVAGFGGFQKQYQVELDPTKLLAYGIPIGRVVAAIRGGNRDVGGRLVELAGAEYMVRGRGSARSVDDIGDVVVGTDDKGTPVLVRQLGSVAIGPEIRRGVGDLDGTGDAVGGIVVIRHGENALQVIERVKARLAELAPSFPSGVELVTTYDRSHLIHESIATLKEELVAALIVVSLVVLLFLWHIPSAIVPIVTIPIAILLAFIPMALFGVSSNIMSISGITISIGVLVDGAIVEVENAYKRLERWIAGGRQGDYHAVRLAALREVGPSVFFSLLVIAVGFLPIFALEDQEGRLFKPLAYTKTLTMGIAALLAITLDPAVRMLFTRVDFVHFRPRPLAWLFNQVAVGRYVPEEQHPVSRVLFRLYEKPCRFVVRHRTATIVAAVLLVLTTVPVYRALGSEFMPPLWEGDLLHMPITLPGISVGEAQKLLRSMDAELKSFPEVDRVHGKAGRADTSTDPAPLSMMETVVHLKPQSEWRSRDRWYARWPSGRRGRCGRSGPTASRARSCSPRWRSGCASPARRTRWRDRSRRASTCSRPASGRRSASRSSATISRRSRASPWRSSRSCAKSRARSRRSRSAPRAATSSTSTSAATDSRGTD